MFMYYADATRMTLRRDSDSHSSDTTIPTDRIDRSIEERTRPKQFYKWKISSKLPSIKIWLDRLSLLALLDRYFINKFNNVT